VRMQTLKGLMAGLGVSLLAATAALAQGQSVSPKLAPGVKPQAGYEATTEKLVVANPTPIFSDIMPTSSQTGQLDKIGEPVNVLAKVKDWEWVLVGKDGQGIGYVPDDLLEPAHSAKRATKS
jgi:hypothetical protein